MEPKWEGETVWMSPVTGTVLTPLVIELSEELPHEGHQLLFNGSQVPDWVRGIEGGEKLKVEKAVQMGPMRCHACCGDAGDCTALLLEQKRAVYWCRACQQYIWIDRK